MQVGDIWGEQCELTKARGYESVVVSKVTARTTIEDAVDGQTSFEDHDGNREADDVAEAGAQSCDTNAKAAKI